MRHLAHAAEAFIFGSATLVVIGSCVMHGLRAGGRPPETTPPAPNSAAPRKSAARQADDKNPVPPGGLELSEEAGT